MSGLKLGIEQLPKILQQYSESVRMEVDDEAQKVSRKAAARLRRVSPKRKKGGGKYARGWAVKRGEGSGYVVYGKSGTYQIAHLLEHGHAKRNGGRVDPVPAGGHIKPVETWATEEYIRRVKEVISR